MNTLTFWSDRLSRRGITIIGNLQEGTHFDVTGQVVYTAVSLISIMILTVLFSKPLSHQANILYLTSLQQFDYDNSTTYQSKRLMCYDVSHFQYMAQLSA